MTPTQNDMSLWQNTTFRQAVMLVGGITFLRVILLFLSPFNLGGDEAQYWDWSRDLAFGYFSKPPMIAWIIRLETTVCGNSEACIRIASPLLHMGTSLLLYALLFRMGYERAAFWTAVTFATIPAVSFSSGLVSTDVPLLFFWALALLCLYQLLETRHITWVIALGTAVGLGFLSKYAMVYFILCGVLFLGLSKPDRWLLRSPYLLVIAGLVGVFLLPNIIWNAQNDFSTVSHTAANANWGVELLNLESLGDFFGDQFGIFGPLLFPLFIWCAWSVIRNLINRIDVNRHMLMLLCFSIPIVSIVLLQSFISRANANWAATTYVAASALVVLWLLQTSRTKLFYTALGLNIFLGVTLYALSLSPALINAMGMENAFKRVRGWDLIGAHVQHLAAERESDIILADDRLILTDLLYYAQGTEAAFRIWDNDRQPQNHYELTMPFNDAAGQKVLLVARQAVPKSILTSFNSVSFLETFTVQLSPNKRRKVHLYELEGYRGRD